MDEHRRLMMLSKSTSATSVPLKDFKLAGDEAALFIKEIQQQLQTIRSENEDLATNTYNLRRQIQQLEDEKVLASANFNKENMELQTVVGRLQSQLERSEASKQAVEYDLTVAKRKLNDVARNNTHKEVALAKENIQLADDKSSLELKLGEMENELIVSRQLTADNEKRIAILQDEMQQVHADKMAAEAILRAENDKLTGLMSDLQYDNDQLKKSLADSKEGIIKQESDLRRLVADLQASIDREQHLRHELDEVSHRARSLEEGIEAERAAHLESKFNSEIIQLKHQEFQNQLASEKDSCEKLKLANDENMSKLEELEKQLEFERHQSRNANAKLEKTMQAYADVRKQLDQELDVKSHVISETTSKLEVQQDHLDQVKEELSKAKKRMIVLEENCNGNLRELELLLESFCTDVDTGAKTKTKDKTESKSQNEHQKTILENLRKTLFAYQKKITDLKNELENQKRFHKELENDCGNFRDLALSREKSMQQAQQALSQCEEELKQIRTQQSEYTREAGRTSRDLEEVTSELQQQTERCRELEENVNNIKERHCNEVEIHVGYLRELHHVVCSASGEKNTLTRFGWSDLTVTIRESVDTLINNFQRAKEQITQLESSSQEMQHSINELQRAHAASVDRLADRCRERDEDASRQRKQLEKHYEALLTEMNSRTQKTQALCDEAWERVRSKDGLHDGLHAECAQLRGENSNLLQEKKALACACAMLLGALYPLLRARDELAQQRYLLDRINRDGEVCKEKMRALVDTLTVELTRSKEKRKAITTPKSFKSIHPLIRFRVGAICVLAANRLSSMSQHSNIAMFTCNESAISSCRFLVVAGKREKTSPKMKKKKGDLPVKSRSDAAVDWLSDSHMVHGVRDATCGVVDAVAKNAGDASGYMSRAVVKTAKNAFLNLMEATHPRFPPYTVDARNILRERTSLCRILSEGLDKIVHNKELREVVSLFSVENSFTALQRHLLSFTERLHAAEVEKRSLRHNEATLKSSVEELNMCKAEVDKHAKEIKRMKEKERQLVSRGRFEGVCAELESALQRERKAQQLLQEQNSKLMELSSRYENQCHNEAEKEVTLSQAVTSLTEVKMELKRNSQTKRQLEKHVERLQSEREKLQSQVNEAKTALKRAAGEKTSIANYFATVEQTLQYAADDDVISEKLRLHGDELAGKAGPGMKAAKRAVETFVRAQSSAISRINNLESQIISYRTHISSLKRELHDACHRGNENAPDVEFSDLPTRDLSRSIVTAPPSGLDMVPSTPQGDISEFKPLQGEIMEQTSFDQSNVYNRSSHPTRSGKEATIRDLTNTYKSA